MPRVDTIAALKALSPSSTNYPKVYVVSYGDASGNVTPGDGAAGLFYWGGTCLLGRGDDGGTVIKTNSGNQCYYRQNVSGDLRQFGITAHSQYDVNYWELHGGTLLNATNQIDKAIKGLSFYGIIELHTHQVSIKIDIDSTTLAPLTLPAGGSLSCDTPSVKAAANAKFTNLPGSLIIAHHAYIDINTFSDGSIHDCAAIIPEWYVNPAAANSFLPSSMQTVPYNNFSVPAVSYKDLEGVRTDMIWAGDKAIYAGQGASIYDVGIYGFDNCIDAKGAPRFIFRQLQMDCSIGVYAWNEGGDTVVQDIDNEPLLTRQTGIPNEEYWTITGISSGTGGVCHVSVQSVKGAPSGSNFVPLFKVADLANSIPLTDASGNPVSRGDPVAYPGWVSGLVDPNGLGPTYGSCSSASTGRFGNDAAWSMANLVAHVDNTNYLNDTATFDLVGSVYTDSTTSMSTTADGVANNNVFHVTGSIAGLAAGMAVTCSSCSGWPTGTVTVSVVLPRCTGPDPDDGYNGCIVLSSPPTADNTGVTLQFTSPGTTLGSACGSSSQPSCFYYNAGERYVAGNSEAGNDTAKLPASRGGHFGTGFMMDNIAGMQAGNTHVYGHYYNVALFNSANCFFNTLAGDDNGELGAGNSIGIYVAGSSRGCILVGKGPGKPGTAIVSDAFGTVDTAEPAITTTDATGIGNLLAYGTTGTSTNYLTVLSSIQFNARGVAHICAAIIATTKACDTSQANEFVDETVVNSTSLNVNVRGRFGTAPINWSTVCSGNCIYVFPTSINGGSSKHPNKSASSTFSFLSDNTTVGKSSVFEVQHGSAIFQDLASGAGGYGFVSTNSAGTAIATTNIPNTALIFEDDNARILTTVTADSSLATAAEQGALNLPFSYYQWFGSPQAMSVGSSPLAANYQGPAAVQDTGDWPTTGILQVDSEYIAYHVIDGTDLYLDKRGVCGSKADQHALGAMISFMNLIYGCPTNTGATPQFTMDGAGNVAFAQSNLSHGQVYMSLSGTNLQLCPKDGKGIIISGVMREVDACALTPTGGTHTSASTRYYVYAAFHQLAVTSIVAEGTAPHINTRLYVSGPAGTAPADFNNNTPVSCYGITGTSGANVTGYTNTDASTDPMSGNAPYIELVGHDPGAHPHGTGACQYIGLELSTLGHTTAANGVEVQLDGSGQPNPALTLVGMVWMDGSNTANDSVAQRDVASWFKRVPKACTKKGLAVGSTPTTTSGTFVELSTNWRCEFVAWTDYHWGWSFETRAANDNAGGSNAYGADASVGFDGTTAEQELASMVNTTTTAGLKFPMSVSGNKDTAAQLEGKHYITVLGRRNGGGTASFDSGPTSVEVRLMQ